MMRRLVPKRSALPALAAAVLSVLSVTTAAGLATTTKANAVTGYTAQATVAAPTITVKPTSGPPTTKVSVAGTGFGASESVVVDFGATKGIASATSTSTGTFSTSFNVPKAEAPGSYTVTATGQVSVDVASANYLVRTNSPQFHFNGARTGYNQYENVIKVGNVHQLTQDWTDNLTNSVQSSPAIVNGVAYVDGSAGLYAFDATTGLFRWHSPTIAFGASSPAVANGFVYAAAMDGHFYAFKAGGCGAGVSTCQPVWTAAIAGAGSGAQSSPTVANGFVYVTAGTAGSELYAFSAGGTTGCSGTPGTPKTCTPLWMAAPNVVSGSSSPAVVGTVLYVGGTQGLYAYSAVGCGATTCQPLWRGNTAQVGSSTPAVVGGVAYIGAGTQLVAFSTSCTGTCAPLWSFDTGGAVNNSPAVATGTVYIAGGHSLLYALDTGSHHLLWTAAISAADSSSPTVAYGVVYIGATNKVVAYNANGCSSTSCTTPLWSAAMSTGFATPVVANGFVYQGGTLSGGHYMEVYKLAS